jgi:hypothetical protein
MLSYTVYVGWRLTRRNRKSSAKNQASPLKFLMQEALADFSADFLPGTFKFRAEDQRLRPEQTPADVGFRAIRTHTKRIFKLMFGTV